MSYLQKILLGTFETALFLDKGIQRFPHGKNDAIISLALPLLLMPLWVTAFYLEPTPKLGEQSYIWLLGVHALKLFFQLVIFYGMIWEVSRALKKTEGFRLFVTSRNYVALASFIVSAPLILMAVTGAHSWSELFPMFIAIMFYEIALTAFIAAYALNVPWQLAGGIGFLSLFVNEAVSSTLFYFVGIS